VLGPERARRAFAPGGNATSSAKCMRYYTLPTSTLQYLPPRVAVSRARGVPAGLQATSVSAEALASTASAPPSGTCSVACSCIAMSATVTHVTDRLVWHDETAAHS